MGKSFFFEKRYPKRTESDKIGVEKFDVPEKRRTAIPAGEEDGNVSKKHPFLIAEGVLLQHIGAVQPAMLLSSMTEANS